MQIMALNLEYSLMIWTYLYLSERYTVFQEKRYGSNIATKKFSRFPSKKLFEAIKTKIIVKYINNYIYQLVIYFQNISV